MSELSHFEPGDYQGAFALLAELTQSFAGALDLQQTLERALASIAGHVGAEAGSLWLVENEGREVTCLASWGPHPITGLRLPVTEGIVGKSVRENVCQSVLDVSRDPNFSQKMDEQSGFVTRSLVCAPMSFSDQVIGAVEVINKRTGDGRFSEADAHLVRVLASSAGLAIANARLTAAQVENEHVRRELELAAEIQRNLLPSPRPSPFPVHGVNLPARMVSGDFYDFLPIAEGRIAFCLGDVSGKGINAALLMAKTASLYRLLAKDLRSPGELLGRLNDEICETATRGMFVTMAAGIYDPQRGSARLANAGHEPPLFRTRDGSFDRFPAEAPPLGIVPGVEFGETDVLMGGGSIYLCSDGLTEASCADGEALGQAGLERLIERFAAKPIGERIEAITTAASECELHDDLTLLGVSDEESSRA
jgi:sigma-B regulation protein RsbU (phosphoserine phosphatase)